LLLSRLAQSSQLTSWTIETIANVLGRLDDWFPFFIQCAFSHLRHENCSDDAYISEIFERLIYPELHRSFFTQFDERLQKRFLATERIAAEQVMDALARSPCGRLTRASINQLLDGSSDINSILRRLSVQQFLEYLDRSNAYQFPFHLLRQWRLARGA